MKIQEMLGWMLVGIGSVLLIGAFILIGINNMIQVFIPLLYLCFAVLGYGLYLLTAVFSMEVYYE